MGGNCSVYFAGLTPDFNELLINKIKLREGMSDYFRKYVKKEHYPTHL
jgi:hypothetical protein